MTREQSHQPNVADRSSVSMPATKNGCRSESAAAAAPISPLPCRQLRIGSTSHRANAPESAPMPSRRAAGYGSAAIVLPVPLCGCTGRNHAGTGVAFPIILPPFGTLFQEAGLPTSGTPASRALSRWIGCLASGNCGERGTASRRSLPRARHGRDGCHLKLPIDVRRSRRPAGSRSWLRGSLL